MPCKVDMVIQMENNNSSDMTIKEPKSQDLEFKLLNSKKNDELSLPENDDTELFSLRLSDEEDDSDNTKKDSGCKAKETETKDTIVNTNGNTKDLSDETTPEVDLNNTNPKETVENNDNLSPDNDVTVNEIKEQKNEEKKIDTECKLGDTDKNGTDVEVEINETKTLENNEADIKCEVEDTEKTKEIEGAEIETNKNVTPNGNNEVVIDEDISTTLLQDNNDEVELTCDPSSAHSNSEETLLDTTSEKDIEKDESVPKETITIEPEPSKNDNVKTGGRGKRSIDPEAEMETEVTKKRKITLDDESTEQKDPPVIEKIEIDEEDIKSTDKIMETNNVKEEDVTVKFNKKKLAKLLPILKNDSFSSLELEELILTKICEALSSRMEISTLREKVQSQDILNDQYRRRIASLSKQFDDINIVFNRLSVDLRSRTPNPTPIKITRSVGLQVVMPTAVKRGVTDGPVNHSDNSTTASPTDQTKFNQSKVNPKPTKNISSTPKTPVTPVSKSPATTNALVLNNSMVVTSTPNNNSTTNKANNQKTVTQPTKKRSIMDVRNQTKENEKKVDDKPIIDLTDEDPPTNNSKNPPPMVHKNFRLVQNGNPATLLMTPGNQPILIRTDNNTVSNGYINGTTANIVIQNNTPGTKGSTALLAKRVPLTRAPRPTATNTRRLIPIAPSSSQPQGLTHPAPLPIFHNSVGHGKTVPPKPLLKLTKAKDGGGIQLSWTMPNWDSQVHEDISSYQLFAYQETSAPPSSDIWRKIGDIKALPLPMACTLTSFQRGHKYYFAVCAIDIQDRFGQFSVAQPITLTN